MLYKHFSQKLTWTRFLFCISIALDCTYTLAHTDIIGYVGSRANLHLSLPWQPERLIFLGALTHIPSLVIHLFVHSLLLLPVSLYNTLSLAATPPPPSVGAFQPISIPTSPPMRNPLIMHMQIRQT